MSVDSHHAEQISSQLQSLVDSEMKRRGVSARQISIDIIGHDGLVRDIKKGHIPRADKLKAIAEYFDVEFYFGPKREQIDQPEYIIDDGAYGIIPVRDVAVAAGTGHANSNHDHIAQLAFRVDWLKMNSINPQMACLVRAKGDSMEPTIPAGALMLVDHQCTDPREKGIYVFLNPDGAARVKRLSMPENGLMLIESDNRKYPVEVAKKHDINRHRIIGRVVWTGSTLKEKEEKISSKL